MKTGSSENSGEIERYGAVAVILQNDRLLMIRRSQYVLAPGLFCFPGGGIEAGETEEQALVRELQEELGCTVQPVRRLWSHVSSWRVHLTWWLATLDESIPIKPDPAEVESVHWFTLDELATLPDQLESNYRFLEALAREEFTLET
jgi:mutator protein MutT